MLRAGVVRRGRPVVRAPCGSPRRSGCCMGDLVACAAARCSRGCTPAAAADLVAGRRARPARPRRPRPPVRPRLPAHGADHGTGRRGGGAVVHGELAALAPFAAGAGVVAPGRGAADDDHPRPGPKAVSVPEVGFAELGRDAYAAALAGYRVGRARTASPAGWCTAAGPSCTVPSRAWPSARACRAADRRRPISRTMPQADDRADATPPRPQPLAVDDAPCRTRPRPTDQPRPGQRDEQRPRRAPLRPSPSALPGVHGRSDRDRTAGDAGGQGGRRGVPTP